MIRTEANAVGPSTSQQMAFAILPACKEPDQVISAELIWARAQLSKYVSITVFMKIAVVLWSLVQVVGGSE